MPDYTTAPAQTIKEKFSVSTTGGQNEPPIPPFRLGQAPPELAQSPLPAPVSGASIEEMFGPLLGAAEAEQAFASKDVPAATNPWMAFAGALAANTATSLTRNPLFAQQFAQYLEAEDRRRQAIQDENYANELLFSKEKRNRLFAIRGQILEKQLDEALKANDFERAQTAAQNLEKFRETLSRAMLPEKTAAEAYGTRVRGEEERKTLRTRASLETEKTTGVSAKPLTMDQYIDAINSAFKSKGDEGQEWGKVLGFIPAPWLKGPVKGKTELMERIHASAIQGGEPDVQKAARRSLLLSIAKRLEVDPTKDLDQKQLDALKSEFAKLGLTL